MGEDQFKFPYLDRVTAFVEGHDAGKRSVHIAVYGADGQPMSLKKVTIPANYDIPPVGAVVVGDNVRVFCEDADLADVWAFINHHMTGASAMRPIVLRDDSGATIGELWDCSLYCAHWESPEKMRSYLDLAGFDLPE